MKFSPDWCFGLLKQKFRKTYVSSLQDVVDVVNSSADVNHAQLVGTQDGELLVPTYSWAECFKGHFRKVPQIKLYHNFIFSGDKPGVVTLKMYSDSATSTFKLQYDDIWTPTADELPPVIHPVGLSNARQWYLYNQIRELSRWR